jgi:membrane dipeptidase
MSDLVRHVEYMVERMGIDHVGIGADLGVPSYLPDVFNDATAYPRLLAALRDRGFDDVALAKIASENWLRVLGETWK